MDFLKNQPFVDLNGDWSFAFRHGLATEAFTTLEDLTRAGLDVLPCKVPGNFELDLQANGLIEEPFQGLNVLELRKFEDCHVWYGCSFEAEPRDGFEAQLVFEGIDCFAEIYLNGEAIGASDNMLVERVFNVDTALRRQNELLVHIRPAVQEAALFDYPALSAAGTNHYESLQVRKAPHMYGWDIMPRAVSAGIWRPVKLRYRPLERIEEVYLETAKLTDNGQAARLRLHFNTTIDGQASDKYELAIEGVCGTSRFSATWPLHFRAGGRWINVVQPRLWWPRGYGDPALYDVTVSLLKEGEAIDSVAFTHGIRTVELSRTGVTTADGQGDFSFKVNGERVFCKGSNWVPADAYHSRDAARIPAILDMAADIECNILRCWGGNVYEDDLFFDLCDRKGIMVWQDFAMACAVYPQDDVFCMRLRQEAAQVVRRLRQHACLVLWAGDNECDCAWGWNHRGDPNRNVLTRRVLPRVICTEDPGRAFLPSSPFIDEGAYRKGEDFLPENHLWGPRDYFKSEFYRKAICHFASEIGYHGCPRPDSVRRFLSPERVWPYADNPEWILHSTNPDGGTDMFSSPDARLMLMVNQVRALFGRVPDSFAEFAFASQATQAEALKYFIERFRGGKWRRTGIIWWNLMDGWPQFSDAVVDYYFEKKLAYHFIKTVQAHFALLVPEDSDGTPRLTAVNDTRTPVAFDYSVRDIDSGATLAAGRAECPANEALRLDAVAGPGARQSFCVAEWKTAHATGRNHYLAGEPPFDLEQYRGWLAKAGLYAGWWTA